MKKIFLSTLLVLIVNIVLAARYWVGGTGNWSDDTNHWSTANGGAPGAGNLPTNADDVFFNAASSGAAYTVTQDVAGVCRDFNMAAPASGKVTWAGTAALTISGSMDLSGGTAGITRSGTGAITFDATSAKTIKTYAINILSTTTLNGAGGQWTLLDGLSTSRQLTVTQGAFISGNFTLTLGSVTSAGALTRSLDFGTSSVTVGGLLVTGTVWNVGGTNITTTASACTINVRTGASTNSLNNLTTAIAYGVVHFVKFGASSTITSNTASGSTISQLIIDAAMTWQLAAGNNIGITTPTFNSSAGNVITISSTTTGTHTITKLGGGRVCSLDYLDISHSIASPAYVWYAGANSTNNQATSVAGSGWIFTICPSQGNFFKVF